MSDIDLYLSPTQVDPETTKPVVGFRTHQDSAQVATQVAHPKGDSSKHKNLLGTDPTRTAQWLIHGDQGLSL